MLEMRRSPTALRYSPPTVRAHFHVRAAEVHHRLDRQDHPLFQPGILVLAVHVVRNLRLLVELSPDSVSHKLPDNRKPVSGHMPLDGTADVEQPVPGPG